MGYSFVNKRNQLFYTDCPRMHGTHVTVNNSTNNNVSCLNFWDEACWFFTLRVFGLFSSSLLLLANGIRTGDPRGLNKGHSSKFREGSRVRQTPEEGRRIYRPKHCGNNNKDEDNSPKTLNDKNNNVMFFFISDLTIINPWSQCLGQETKKYFASILIWRQSHSKLSQNICNPLIW